MLCGTIRQKRVRKMRKFNGFTLVELMIALAVIGVLSALVIPMLSDNSPNRNKMMMKKAYYTISDVVSDLINDTSLYPEIGSDGTEYVGFDNLEEHGGKSGVAKFPALFPKRLNIDGSVSYQGDNKNTSIFTTEDGMTWVINSTQKAKSSLPTEVSDVEEGDTQVLQTISVDVNGSKKKPNCEQGADSTCPGKTDGFDQFTVYVSQSDKIIPKSGQNWFVDAIGIGSDLNGD